MQLHFRHCLKEKLPVNDFVQLYEDLDSLTSTLDKVEKLKTFFSMAADLDLLWSIYFLTGRRLKNSITSRDLQKYYLEKSKIPEWLFQESYSHVGDTAEVISLLLPAKPDPSENFSLASLIEDHILPSRKKSDEEKKLFVWGFWDELTSKEVYIFNKLLTGALRVGVSQSLVIQALAQAFDVTISSLNQKLMGDWTMDENFVLALKDQNFFSSDPSKPYPFYLASPLEKELAELGSIEDWCTEWKWDGIRAQLVKREGEVFLWSRGEDLVNQSFPELVEAAAHLPDGIVLDGEILVWTDRVAPFSDLQKRLGRKKVSPAMKKNYPVVLLAYDLLEMEGQDLRMLSLRERRGLLEKILHQFAHPSLQLSPLLNLESWQSLMAEQKKARENFVEGLMLKRWTSTYQEGRKRGDWWKYKIDPLQIDAVLLYAQAGSGKRSNLHTDYTFALWEGEQLVPIAKAYSGLTNEEIEKLDNWIRRNTKEKFGPVRSVNPHFVFELAFEGVSLSSRHKSGVALRFPRISRWRHDKKIEDANKLDDLKSLIISGNKIHA